LKLWDLQSGENKGEFRGHEHVVECVYFVPLNANAAISEFLQVPLKQSHYIISGSRDKTMKLWDSTTMQCVHTFIGHDNWVRGISFTNTGKHFVSVSDDKTLKIWEWKSARCSKTFEAHTHFVTCVNYNPRLPLLVTGSVDQAIKLWECR
jgi:platelet-activating factor acetylhydrolase IB subunit alpha